MNESTLMNNLALHGMYTSTTGTTSTAQVRPRHWDFIRMFKIEIIVSQAILTFRLQKLVKI